MPTSCAAPPMPWRCCRTRSAGGGVDDQRRQCGTGRGLCGEEGRHALHGRGDRVGAGSEARTHAGAGRATSSRRSYERAGRRSMSAAFPVSKARSSIPSTITISSPATPPWGLEILEDAPEPVGDRRHRRRRAGGGVASAVKALKPSTKVFGAEPETAAPAALSFAKGSPQVFPDWQLRSSTAPAGRACFPACGSACEGWSRAASW